MKTCTSQQWRKWPKEYRSFKLSTAVNKPGISTYPTGTRKICYFSFTQNQDQPCLGSTGGKNTHITTLYWVTAHGYFILIPKYMSQLGRWWAFKVTDLQRAFKHWSYHVTEISWSTIPHLKDERGFMRPRPPKSWKPKKGIVLDVQTTTIK
jgi:hypothetical protein